MSLTKMTVLLVAASAVSVTTEETIVFKIICDTNSSFFLVSFTGFKRFIGRLSSWKQNSTGKTFDGLFIYSMDLCMYRFIPFHFILLICRISSVCIELFSIPKIFKNMLYIKGSKLMSARACVLEHVCMNVYNQQSFLVYVNLVYVNDLHEFQF